MIIGLDIDDTITAQPALFAALSRAPGVRRVVVVSTRTDLPEARRATEEELRGLGIRYHLLHLLPGQAVAEGRCPHVELDGYRQYLWQKVDFCREQGVEVMFEDDDKVIALFHRYAPEIGVVKVTQP